jgi:hypothetical protein
MHACCGKYAAVTVTFSMAVSLLLYSVDLMLHATHVLYCGVEYVISQLREWKTCKWLDDCDCTCAMLFGNKPSAGQFMALAALDTLLYSARISCMVS